MFDMLKRKGPLVVYLVYFYISFFDKGDNISKHKFNGKDTAENWESCNRIQTALESKINNNPNIEIQCFPNIPNFSHPSSHKIKSRKVHIKNISARLFLCRWC